MSTTAHILAWMLLAQAPIVGSNSDNAPAPLPSYDSSINNGGAPQVGNGGYQIQSGSGVLQKQGAPLNLQNGNPNNSFVPNSAPLNSAPLNSAPLNSAPQILQNPALQNPARQNPARQNPARQNPAVSNSLYQSNQNSNVRPAEYQAQPNNTAPQVTNLQPTGDSSAPLVLRLSLSPPAVDAITGEDLALSDAVTGSYDLQKQSQVVKAYWRLSHALGTYNMNRDGLESLVSMPVPQNQTELAVLKAAIQQTRAEVAEARLMVIAQQYQVAELLGADEASSPPIPSDSPWVGMYRSNFDSLFAGRSKPVGIRRLHKSLPLFVDLIDHRAEAVLTAQDAFNAMTGAYRGGQARLQEVLNLHELLGMRRREFLLSVRDYNFSIADYATNAVHSGGVNSSHYVAMLIPTTTTQRTTSVLLNR